MTNDRDAYAELVALRESDRRVLMDTQAACRALLAKLDELDVYVKALHDQVALTKREESATDD